MKRFLALLLCAALALGIVGCGKQQLFSDRADPLHILDGSAIGMTEEQLLKQDEALVAGMSNGNPAYTRTLEKDGMKYELLYTLQDGKVGHSGYTMIGDAEKGLMETEQMMELFEGMILAAEGMKGATHRYYTSQKDYMETIVFYRDAQELLDAVQQSEGEEGFRMQQVVNGKAMDITVYCGSTRMYLMAAHVQEHEESGSWLGDLADPLGLIDERIFSFTENDIFTTFVGATINIPAHPDNGVSPYAIPLTTLYGPYGIYFYIDDETKQTVAVEYMPINEERGTTVQPERIVCMVQEMLPQAQERFGPLTMQCEENGEKTAFATAEELIEHLRQWEGGMECYITASGQNTMAGWWMECILKEGESCLLYGVELPK